jgi:chromosome segregation ATPase
VKRVCKVSKILNDLEGMAETLQNEPKRLHEQLNQCEREISEIYHKIEQEEFSEQRGNNLAKELQKVLRKRRLIKKELYSYRILKQTVRPVQNISLSHIKGAKKALKGAKSRTRKYVADWDIKNLNNDDFKMY